MPQHDMIIDNGPGLAVRTDINAAIQALVQQNSGPVEPATMYPGMLWLDTTVVPDGQVRMRNQTNTGWVTPSLLGPDFGNVVVSVAGSSATWTKLTGLRFLEIWVIGGGGGSISVASTSAAQSNAGGAGGGGGAVYKFYAASALAATESYTVGAGGAGGAPSAGGTSTFKGLAAAGGAASGAASGNTATLGAGASGGAGGSASGGDLNISGGYGTNGMANPHNKPGFAMPGMGGTSYFSLISGPVHYMTATASPGNAGRFPGGGAQGAANGASQGSTAAGAAGAAGCIIFKEYY